MTTARITCGILVLFGISMAAPGRASAGTSAFGDHAAYRGHPQPVQHARDTGRTVSDILVAQSTGDKSEQCTDRTDNDGDGMIDCADADCFADPACEPGKGEETTDSTCSDWVDNDGDGVFDCDDADCFGPLVTVCKGSWKGPLAVGGGGGAPPAGDTVAATSASDQSVLPKLEEGLTVEDLIGRGRDKDGERNDELCSDGIDNDNDGMIDCADYGCRFDPAISICRGNPDLRFSVVASLGQIYDITENLWDTRPTKLQVRAFGPLPYIQDSFFLLSFRTEKTVRNTFAMFSIPLGKGHFVNVNTGGGGLSSALIISDAKQLLLDPAYYVYNAFEQGNGAAAEVSGPLTTNRTLLYRVFAAGGAGRWTGNIGGRYFKYDNTNYTYAFGGQLGINAIGYHNRFDTPYLFTPVPLTLAFLVGAKYDQRANERFPATNVFMILRWRWLHFAVENYSRRVLDYGSWQTAYNAQIGILAVPKRLLLACDYGQYIALPFENPPDSYKDLDVKPLNETQFRAAIHYYFWKNIALLSLRYQDHATEVQTDETLVGGTSGADGSTEYEHEREVRLEVQYRF